MQYTLRRRKGCDARKSGPQLHCSMEPKERFHMPLGMNTVSVVLETNRHYRYYPQITVSQ